MSGWKGKISCRSFLPKFERAHYLRLCGVELQPSTTTGEDALHTHSLTHADHLPGKIGVDKGRGMSGGRGKGGQLARAQQATDQKYIL